MARAIVFVDGRIADGYGELKYDGVMSFTREYRHTTNTVIGSVVGQSSKKNTGLTRGYKPTKVKRAKQISRVNNIQERIKK